MLVTKAIIKRLPGPGNNIFRVRIPLFEQAGVQPGESFDSLYDATLCYTPGTAYSLEVEDVVFVTFSDNHYSDVVIIGKLFLNTKEEFDNPQLNIKANALEVRGKSILSKDTSIGNISGQELISSVQQVKNLTEQLEHINNRDIRMMFTAAGKLRVYLQNFKETDVGAYIDLYRTTKSGSKGYKHPVKYGYGVIAEKPRGREELGDFPAVPSWMPKNGLIQTRWILTTAIISQGYFEIDWQTEWLPLAVPDEDDEWVQIYGVGNAKAKDHGAVKIKFGFVRDNNLTFLSSSTIKLGKGLGNEIVEVVSHTTDPNTGVTTYFLDSSVIYKTIM